MPYVRGHARGLGWVVAHLRRPHRDEERQLALDEQEAHSDEVSSIPAPRAAPDNAPRRVWA